VLYYQEYIYIYIYKVDEDFSTIKCNHNPTRGPDEGNPRSRRKLCIFRIELVNLKLKEKP
jgi:hypothetical protein